MKTIKTIKIIVILLTFPSCAYAYLDPGSASLWLQSMLAILAVVIYNGRRFWNYINLKLRNIFCRKSWLKWQAAQGGIIDDSRS